MEKDMQVMIIIIQEKPASCTQNCKPTFAHPCILLLQVIQDRCQNSAEPCFFFWHGLTISLFNPIITDINVFLFNPAKLGH